MFSYENLYLLSHDFFLQNVIHYRFLNLLGAKFLFVCSLHKDLVTNVGWKWPFRLTDKIVNYQQVGKTLPAHQSAHHFASGCHRVQMYLRTLPDFGM